MTNFSDTARSGVNGTSQVARTGSTFRLQQLMEEAQKLEIAQRITVLRERSPFTQPDIADKLGIRLRSYQKLEDVGTTKFERCEELAEIHREWTQRSDEWRHVTADWIWDGKQRSATPDLLRQLDGPSPRSEEAAAVASLREEVAELGGQMDSMQTKLFAALDELRADLQAVRRQQKPPERRKGSKGK